MRMGCESKVAIGTVCVLLEFNQLTKSIWASQEKAINTHPDMIQFQETRLIYKRDKRKISYALLLIFNYISRANSNC